jgi:hypothetical protein
MKVFLGSPRLLAGPDNTIDYSRLLLNDGESDFDPGRNGWVENASVVESGGHQSFLQRLCSNLFDCFG